MMTVMSRLQRFTATAVLLTALLTGCASDPVATGSGRNEAERASAIAASMVGKPYRYGGHNPDRGFDCSGLVYFSFQRAGMSVPRSTETQRQRSRKVAAASLARGDLVFFNQEGKFSSHVGIYLGKGRFVHAPSSGKKVRIEPLGSLLEETPCGCPPLHLKTAPASGICLWLSCCAPGCCRWLPGRPSPNCASCR